MLLPNIIRIMEMTISSVIKLVVIFLIIKRNTVYIHIPSIMQDIGLYEGYAYGPFHNRQNQAIRQ